MISCETFDFIWFYVHEQVSLTFVYPAAWILGSQVDMERDVSLLELY